MLMVYNSGINNLGVISLFRFFLCGALLKKGLQILTFNFTYRHTGTSMRGITSEEAIDLLSIHLKLFKGRVSLRGVFVVIFDFFQTLYMSYRGYCLLKSEILNPPVF